MNVLIYKRTHSGDPSESGIFGVHDCLGSIRCRGFDAVIGIGGRRPRRGYEDIAYKVNWVGINPIKTEDRQKRGPIVRFKHFVLYEGTGPDLRTVAPKLFKYMFQDRYVRVVMSKSLPGSMQKEIAKLSRLAVNHESKKKAFIQKGNFNQRCKTIGGCS